MTDRRLAEALLAAYERARRSVGIVEAFDAVAAEARRLLVRTPTVGDEVERAVGNGFRMERGRVAKADGSRFRCAGDDRWLDLTSEWVGPFDRPRPIGMLWRRVG